MSQYERVTVWEKLMKQKYIHVLATFFEDKLVIEMRNWACFILEGGRAEQLTFLVCISAHGEGEGFSCSSTLWSPNKIPSDVLLQQLWVERDPVVAFILSGTFTEQAWRVGVARAGVAGPAWLGRRGAGAGVARVMGAGLGAAWGTQAGHKVFWMALYCYNASVFKLVFLRVNFFGGCWGRILVLTLNMIVRKLLCICGGWASSSSVIPTLYKSSSMYHPDTGMNHQKHSASASMTLNRSHAKY